MAPSRLYAGEKLRELRSGIGLGQAAMATRLGVSVSYLSQLENNARPLTAAVIAALNRHHPAVMAAIDGEAPARRLGALAEALTDPVLSQPLDPEAIQRLAVERPDAADRVIALHRALRDADARVQMVEEVLASGVGARMPWEAVRDWFHESGNYVDPLDRAAETLAGEIAGEGALGESALTARLAAEGVECADGADDAAPLRQFDAARGLLTINAALPVESRRFLVAHQLAAICFAESIAAIVDHAELGSDAGQTLLGIGLANYAAGALMMPYARFRATARGVRHDIDRLSRRFGVSFEQACHRLSTLQRPNAKGVPFYFCRVDMAGNITKRHSATRLQFARFGGACPLWMVHEAVAIPDRILVQHAETPDGVRYVSMAKGLVKPSGSFTRAPRRYAVVLGCEADQARDFVYADPIDRAAAPTPIGISCRLCPRATCDQRAFPPADRTIHVDPAVRAIVPYQVR